MSDPFDLSLDEGMPPRFDDAVREAVARLEVAAAEFETLLGALPEDAFTADEWSVIELAAGDIEKAAEMAEEGYLAAAFDSHAWYRVMENLERVLNRLDSALGIMRLARDRPASEAEPATRADPED
jgi:hypothetical protein